MIDIRTDHLACAFYLPAGGTAPASSTVPGTARAPVHSASLRPETALESRADSGRDPLRPPQGQCPCLRFKAVAGYRSASVACRRRANSRRLPVAGVSSAVRSPEKERFVRSARGGDPARGARVTPYSPVGSCDY